MGTMNVLTELLDRWLGLHTGEKVGADEAGRRQKA